MVPDGYVDNFTYDSVGNVAAKISSSVNIQNNYDLLSRLISRTVNGKTISHEYDKNGNRTKMTDPESGITTYEYNAFNQVTSIADFNNDITIFDYDKLGRRERIDCANSDFSISYSSGPH